jgi:beta-xylosidase
VAQTTSVFLPLIDCQARALLWKGKLALTREADGVQIAVYDANTPEEAEALLRRVEQITGPLKWGPWTPRTRRPRKVVRKPADA